MKSDERRCRDAASFLLAPRPKAAQRPDQSPTTRRTWTTQNTRRDIASLLEPVLDQAAENIPTPSLVLSVRPLSPAPCGCPVLVSLFYQPSAISHQPFVPTVPLFLRRYCVWLGIWPALGLISHMARSRAGVAASANRRSNTTDWTTQDHINTSASARPIPSKGVAQDFPTHGSDARHARLLSGTGNWLKGENEKQQRDSKRKPIAAANTKTETAICCISTCRTMIARPGQTAHPSPLRAAGC